MADTSVIIVAGGNSTRMNGVDKQFSDLGGIPVIARSIMAFENCIDVFEIIVATRLESIEKIENLCKKYNFTKVKAVVKGGETRAESVRNAFEKVSKSALLVAIHDGARPLIADNDIMRVLSKARKHNAATLCVPVKDTIKIANDEFIEDTPNRANLYAAQTPQVFKYAIYKKALENSDLGVTDDCMAVEATGQKVYITIGSYNNIKITTPDDLIIANAILGGEKKMRIGSGYDVHKLVENRKLILGGVEIPFELGLLGHSDADVLLHAIMDALLGAAALGDIGKHFPDTDEAYKGANSLTLLKKVGEILSDNGYEIENIDSTVIAQKPKIAGYIPEMRKNIAKALNIDLEQVSVKATTEEGLGFTGNLEGISASAVCMIK